MLHKTQIIKPVNTFILVSGADENEIKNETPYEKSDKVTFRGKSKREGEILFPHDTNI